MTSNTIERTYETIANAQKLADKFNQFLDWYKDVEGFHSVKELREMYFNREDAGRHRYNSVHSDASQMSHWMRKLWGADVVEVRREWVEQTITLVGYHYNGTEPEKIDVWDANGNKFTINNPKYDRGEYVYGEYTKTVNKEVLYFCRKG